MGWCLHGVEGVCMFTGSVTTHRIAPPFTAQSLPPPIFPPPSAYLPEIVAIACSRMHSQARDWRLSAMRAIKAVAEEAPRVVGANRAATMRMARAVEGGEGGGGGGWSQEGWKRYEWRYCCDLSFSTCHATHCPTSHVSHLTSHLTPSPSPQTSPPASHGTARRRDSTHWRPCARQQRPRTQQR